MQLTKSLIPGLEELTVWALKSSVQYALNDEYVKTLAKDSVRDMILSKLAQVMAHQQEAREKALAEQRQKEKEREKDSEATADEVESVQRRKKGGNDDEEQQ